MRISLANCLIYGPPRSDRIRADALVSSARPVPRNYSPSLALSFSASEFALFEIAGVSIYATYHPRVDRGRRHEFRWTSRTVVTPPVSRNCSGGSQLRHRPHADSFSLLISALKDARARSEPRFANNACRHGGINEGKRIMAYRLILMKSLSLIICRN